MNVVHVYAIAGIVLFAIGIYALIERVHLLRKVLALNVMGSGAFLLLGAFGVQSRPPDPVPQALIITGIVVAVAATALALVLAVRVAEETGRAELPRHEPPEPS